MNIAISKRQRLCITGQSKCLIFNHSDVQLYNTHKKSSLLETGTFNVPIAQIHTLNSFSPVLLHLMQLPHYFDN